MGCGGEVEERWRKGGGKAGEKWRKTGVYRLTGSW